MMDNVKLHDTAYDLFDRIESLRDMGLPVSLDNLRSQVDATISDAFISCVISFEEELQTINQQCPSCETGLCSCGLCHSTQTGCKDFSSQCGNDS